MMRIAPDGFLRFQQAMPGKVNVKFAGGEANVAASLAMFGNQTRYLTAIPDTPITQSMLTVLRGLQIDTKHILMRKEGRFGVYFLETGANQRSSNVVYDREGTAISQAAPSEYDFDAALEDVHWVHTTGITPALSRNAFESALELVRRAKEKGATVSCDLNFRKKLWRWQPDRKQKALAKECMSQILAYVDVVIGNEEDAADVLGIHAEGTSVEAGQINAAAYEKVARTIVRDFPNVSRVAITLRESISATHNNWGGMLFDSETDKAYLAPLDDDGNYRSYEIRSIVDRVGGGDSFGAGLIHALNSEDFADPELAIRFAVAASCLKHSIKGDFNYVTLDEVKALAGGQASGRVRR
ncbi:MAG: sugar kinase [Candidatus Pacebacteria bacterium]|nr:sugar kinase [Candidatus Paceibacterota bacterium]